MQKDPPEEWGGGLRHGGGQWWVFPAPAGCPLEPVELWWDVPGLPLQWEDFPAPSPLQGRLSKGRRGRHHVPPHTAGGLGAPWAP